MGGDYSSLFLLRGVKERASKFKNVYTATTNTAFKDGDVSMQSHPSKSWYHHFRKVEDIDDIFFHVKLHTFLSTGSSIHRDPPPIHEDC